MNDNMRIGNQEVCTFFLCYLQDKYAFLTFNF